MTSLEQLFKEAVGMGHDAIMVGDPIIIFILERENPIYPFSNKSERVEKICIGISIVKPINSGFKFLKIFLQLKKVIKITDKIMFHISKEGTMRIIEGVLNSLKPSSNNFLFLKDITKSLLIPNNDIFLKFFNSVSQVWVMIQFFLDQRGKVRVGGPHSFKYEDTRFDPKVFFIKL